MKKQIDPAEMSLLKAMGKILPKIFRSSRYNPHQGPRECARRVLQMERLKWRGQHR